VSCSFDLAHYGEILEAGKVGGYRFRTFGEGPERGDIFLRHGIDVSLGAALTMAEREATYGVRTTIAPSTGSPNFFPASGPPKGPPSPPGAGRHPGSTLSATPRTVTVAVVAVLVPVTVVEVRASPPVAAT